ncbi:MAG: hypothetical protein OXN17_16920 [Candidatus Poribacteria bacterium]|nr:hypothetical protein [Candidatus Poribacteria bacterium]MDE0506943.1 hypothetical protein [Candidatus Poribacteria bacterium]
MNEISDMRNITSSDLCRFRPGFHAWTVGGLLVLIWAIGLCPSMFSLPTEVYAEALESTSVAQEQLESDSQGKVESDSVEDSDDEEMIEILAQKFNRDEKKGVSIWTGNVRMTRPNGFLNADKVSMYEDAETGEYIKTVAERNVEIRDEDMFATCEHAIINHTDDTVDLRDNVIVIQNADRLEAKHFTFNRRTGKQTADGGVKFRVRMTRQKKTADTPTEAKE